MRRVLFLCGKNRRRSPTAEQIFRRLPAIEVASAGLDPDSDERVSGELLDWADVIFVMQRSYRQRLSRQFRAHIKDQKIVCLDIPDRYDYMDEELQTMLRAKVLPHLGMSNTDNKPE